MPLLPRTRSGWWGLGVTLAGVALLGVLLVTAITPLGTYLALIAGGIVSLVAVLRHGERSFATAGSLALGAAAVATLVWIAIAESL